MGSRIRALIVKEFHALLRDKRSRIVLIVPPLVQLFIFAFAATLDVKNVSLGVLNLDSGRHSIELIQRFVGSPTFRHLTFLESEAEIAPFIDNQRGQAVLFIDQQFSRKIEAGERVDLQLILDGRKSNTTQIISGYVSQIVSKFSREMQPSSSDSIGQSELIPRNFYNPNLIYMWMTVPGLAGILTMLEALIITALSVARERELGTFDQLLVSPAESFEIMVAKAVPAVVISMLEGSLIVLCAVTIFGIPFTGSVLLFYLAMFVFVCCIVGVGLFISSLCFTQQQAILGSSFFMTPSVVLSGFATPIQNMPDWLQPVTYLVPLRYFMTIVKGSFLKEMPPSVVWDNLWPLLLIAVATLSTTTWMFRHRLQ